MKSLSFAFITAILISALLISCGKKDLPDFVAQIKAAGGPVKIDIMSGMNHGTACDKAFTAKRLKWLFEQKKDSQ